MKYFITGGAGFIGSHLIDRLIEENEITVCDNLSSGSKDFIKVHLDKSNFKFIQADLLDLERLEKEMKGHEFVFHLAANPDIRYGITNTDTDLKQGTVVTYNVLESMRINNVKKIVFSSSSVVYGEPTVLPTPEDYGPLIPISLYGASKLACEGLITGFCHTFSMQCWIFRFANIVGIRSTHGILVDFIEKLRRTPHELEILGDGHQKKSYLSIDDCLDAILFAIHKSNERVNVFNLSGNDDIAVSKIAEMVVAGMGLRDVHFRYTGGRRGWPGDVPLMKLSPERINKLGWQAKHSSGEAVRRAVKDLVQCK